MSDFETIGENMYKDYGMAIPALAKAYEKAYREYLEQIMLVRQIKKSLEDAEKVETIYANGQRGCYQALADLGRMGVTGEIRDRVEKDTGFRK